MFWTVVVAGIAMASAGAWWVERTWRKRYENALRFEKRRSRELGDELAMARMRLHVQPSDSHIRVHSSTFIDRPLTPAQKREWQGMEVMARGRF